MKHFSMLLLLTTILLTGCGTTRVIDAPFDEVMKLLPQKHHQKHEVSPRSVAENSSPQKIDKAVMLKLKEHSKQYVPVWVKHDLGWFGNTLTVSFAEVRRWRKSSYIEPIETEITIKRLNDKQTEVTVHCEKSRLFKFSQRLKSRELAWIYRVEFGANKN